MWRWFLLLVAALGGIWWGREAPRKAPSSSVQRHPEKEFPVIEHKSFALVLYGYNQALWCERSLHSVFEQEYDHYRVLFIDDASSDGTGERAKQFVLDNHQEEKVVFFSNEQRLGPVASLYKVIDRCLDREIVLFLDVKDWLSSPYALSRMNRSYQNPEVWLTSCQAIEYPSYAIREAKEISFYAALFKQLKLHDLYQKGHFASSLEACLTPMRELGAGRIAKLEEPLFFDNTASFVKPLDSHPLEGRPYPPLAAFPSPNPEPSADLLIFSFDRPLQLYACLESIQRYITGFEKATVLYRASTPQFAVGYEEVKQAFPAIEFVAQSSEDPKHDFKPHVQQIVFDSPSPYLLFAVDDIIVKDFVDLKLCMQQMEKTGAYGFYLRFGRHINHCYQFERGQKLPPSHLLAEGIYAWDFEVGELDWGFPHSLDMTLFRKGELREPLAKMKYKTPNSLEFNWGSGYRPKRAVGLYFDHSKLVNVPMNLVGRTGNPHMNYLSTEELLTKFNQGLKIDIEPLYKIENRSPHMDYIPEFILR